MHARTIQSSLEGVRPVHGLHAQSNAAGAGGGVPLFAALVRQAAPFPHQNSCDDQQHNCTYGKAMVH